MFRKWTTLAVTMSAVALVFTGLSLAAQDEGSPLEKIMESVQKHNLALTKATRTKPAFAKTKPEEIAEHADGLIADAKKARAEKGPSEKQKKPYTEWTKLMDNFIKKTEDFKGVAAKSGATFEAAKKSFAEVKSACTDCHNTFRVDE
jgi:cytochrome c556